MKQFYVRVVRQLILSTDLQEARYILLSTIITALSETEGYYNSSSTVCEVNKKKLLQNLAFGIHHNPAENFVSVDGINGPYTDSPVESDFIESGDFIA